MTTSATTPATDVSEDRRTLYNMDLEVLGDRLRRARLEKKVSQRDLSAGLFTSAYLSSLELGKTRPTYDTLINLAQRLDKSTDYFLRQASGMATEMDEEQVRILEIRLALLSAHTALEELADDRAEKALQQVGLHLARLTASEKARYYYLRGRYFNMREDPASALAELEQARKFLAEGYDAELEVLIEYGLGTAHYTQRRIMPALTHFLAAYDLVSAAKETMTINLKWRVLLCVANCYLLLNDWNQAIGSYKEALDEAGTSLLPTRQAAIYWGLASSYREQGDFMRAALNLGRCLQIYEEIEDQVQLLRTRNALAQMYTETGQYESAEEQVNEALRLARTAATPDQCDEMNAIVTLAKIRQKQTHLEEAHTLIEQALSGSENCNDVFRQGRLYRAVAEIQADLGNREASEQFYQKAFEVLEPSGLANSLADIYHSYGQVLRNWGEVERAFEYMEKAYKQRERGRLDRELERR